MELDLTHHTLSEAVRVHVCLVQDLQGHLFARCPVPGAVDAPEAPAANDLMVVCGLEGEGGESMGEEGEGAKRGKKGKRTWPISNSSMLLACCSSILGCARAAGNAGL